LATTRFQEFFASPQILRFFAHQALEFSKPPGKLGALDLVGTLE
jgi:hypothetical protein